MKPARKPLAVLISAIGLGVTSSAEAMAHATDAMTWAPVLNAGTEDVLPAISAVVHEEDAETQRAADESLAAAVPFAAIPIDLTLAAPDKPAPHSFAPIPEDLKHLACEQPNPSWPIDLCMPDVAAASGVEHVRVERASDKAASRGENASTPGFTPAIAALACDQPNPSWPMDLCLPQSETNGKQPTEVDGLGEQVATRDADESVADVEPLVLALTLPEERLAQHPLGAEAADVARLACEEPNPSWPMDLCWPARQEAPAVARVSDIDPVERQAAPVIAEAAAVQGQFTAAQTLDLVLTIPERAQSPSSRPLAERSAAAACDEPNPSWAFDLCFAPVSEDLIAARRPQSDSDPNLEQPPVVAAHMSTAAAPAVEVLAAAVEPADQVNAPGQSEEPVAIDLVLSAPVIAGTMRSSPQPAEEDDRTVIASNHAPATASANEQRMASIADTLLQEQAIDPAALATPQRLLLAEFLRDRSQALSPAPRTDEPLCTSVAPTIETRLATWLASAPATADPAELQTMAATGSNPEALDLVLTVPQPRALAPIPKRAEDLIVFPSAPSEAAATQAGDSTASGWQKVAASKLDTVRGGFTTDNGLRISFGIERAVYINGNLVTTTSFRVSDLDRITAGQAAAIDPAMLTLIQNGPGNTFTSTASPSAIGTAIQNTLNDQKIQNITVINATVNSLDILRSLNLQSTLRNAVSESLGK